MLRTVPEVVSTQTYAGTAAPFNFNGLVRHYFLRQGTNVADVQVNLLPKGERSRQSHDIAVAVRPLVVEIAARYGARAKIAEIPPGPPVMSTLVAEVYGPDDATRLAAAERVRQVMEATPGVVDVDWSVEAPQQRLSLRVDRARAGAAGVAVEQITSVLALGLSGMPVGLRVAADGARAGDDRAAARRGGSAAISRRCWRLPVATPTGPLPLGRFVHGGFAHAHVGASVAEPAAADLHHRRRGRRGGVAGVRHPRDESRRSTPCASTGRRLRATTPCNRPNSTSSRSSGMASGR